MAVGQRLTGISMTKCPATAGALTLLDPDRYGRGTPHELWTRMRAAAPVARQVLPDGCSFWSVTSYGEAVEVFRNAATFTSEQGTLLDQLGQGDPAGGVQLVATDPPRHTILRKPLQRALAARAAAAMRGRLREVVRAALAPLAEDGACDLAERMRMLAVGVMGTLMDLPAADWPRLAALALASVAPEDPLFGQPGKAEHVLRGTHRELLAYFHDLVRERRVRPGDDLVSLLIAMTVDGRPLTRAEVASNCYGLLLGGTVTISQVPATTLADLMGTAELAEWAADPGLLAGGVEESLRWATPNTHFMRYAVRDTGLRGEPIAAGDAVVVWLASANRDEDVFADPFRFDVRRRPNKHLSFGIGPHYCVGNAVVREVLKLFYGELFGRFTGLSSAGPGARLHSSTIAGWRSLPITAKAGPPRGRPAC